MGTDLVATREAEKETKLAKMTEGLALDWRTWNLQAMATILRRMPQSANSAGVTQYLTDEQAIAYAIRCTELGVSPFSSETWFNTKTNTVNLTLEGKRTVARKQGYQFGPPVFKRLTRPFRTGTKVVGFDEDVGYECSMQAKGFEDRVTYTAWLSEWYMPRSTVWKDKPEHMLQVRSTEKALSMGSGVGASELPADNDLTGNQVEQAAVKSESTPVDFVAPTKEVSNE